MEEKVFRLYKGIMLVSIREFLNKEKYLVVGLLCISCLFMGYYIKSYLQPDSCVIDIANNDIVSGNNLIAELSGAVVEPGVYELSDGSRLSDLVKQGQGFTFETSAGWVAHNINLAEKLTDGVKVYIPFEWEIYAPANITVKEMPLGSLLEKPDVVETSSSISVNSASELDLDKLPGVGESYVKKITGARPYLNLEDFKSRSGLPTSLIDKISSLIDFL